MKLPNGGFRWIAAVFLLCLFLPQTGAGPAFGDDRTGDENRLLAAWEDFFSSNSSSRGPLGTGPRPVCGTPLIQETRLKWPHLSESAKNALLSHEAARSAAQTGQRPQLRGTVKQHVASPFKFHYTLESADAVSATDVSPANGVPDYVDQLADAFALSWDKEIVQMEWTRPPSDGDGLIDVYLTEMEGLTVGYTIPETLVGDNPNSEALETLAQTSYIQMRNVYDPVDFPNADLYKTIAAHELLHVVQYGYNGYEASWMLEAGATWVEDEVFDDVNDGVELLTEHFNAPDYSLNHFPSGSLHPYAMWIYFRYMSEHLGLDALKAVWGASVAISDPTGEDRSMEAIAAGLTEMGSGMRQFTADFAAANLILSVPPDNPPWNYEEAALYPSARREANITPTASGTVWDSSVNGNGRLGFYGADYLNILTGPGAFKVDFQAKEAKEDFGVFAVWQVDDVYQVEEVPLDSSGAGSLVSSGPSDSFYILISNLNDATENPGYSVAVASLPGKPVITSTPCLLGDVGSAYRYDCLGYDSGSSKGRPVSDASGGEFQVTWEAVSAPSGFSVNAGNGDISWTPEEPGDYAVSLVAKVEGLESDPQTFTVNVEPAEAPPLPPSQFLASPGIGAVTLTAAGPSDPDLSGCSIVRNADRVPTSPTDGASVYEGACKSVSWTDSGLNADTTYYYSIFSYDASKNPTGSPLSVCATPRSVQLAYRPGWNLVSLPMKPVSADIGPLFLSATACGTATLDGGRYAQPGNISPGFYSPGTGVWVCSETEKSGFALSGAIQKYAEYSLQLYSTWNAIGDPYIEPLEWGDSAVAIGPAGQEVPLSQAAANGWTNGMAYRYLVEANEYEIIPPNEGQHLEPWTGYFLKIEKTCANCSIRYTPAACAF